MLGYQQNDLIGAVIMKKINKNIISTMVFAISCLAFSASIAVTNASTPSAKSSAKVETTPTAASANLSQSKITQDFQNDDLSVQFRYVDGKIIGLRLKNTGTQDMKVTISNTNYILGPNDSVVINPPNVTSMHIFHGPASTPVSSIEEIFPNRFSKHEIYIIPKDISDQLVNKSGAH